MYAASTGSGARRAVRPEHVQASLDDVVADRLDGLSRRFAHHFGCLLQHLIFGRVEHHVGDRHVVAVLHQGHGVILVRQRLAGRRDTFGQRRERQRREEVLGRITVTSTAGRAEQEVAAELGDLGGVVRNRVRLAELLQNQVRQPALQKLRHCIRGDAGADIAIYGNCGHDRLL
jgi:hypothetical protein